MQKRKVAAVICEYNPFHAGHAALFNALRRQEGEDTAIVAIMSGNFTQRGEAAIFPKLVRAASAIRGGADLVLELPFPYACSGAERFATAGVRIANALGCVDALFFGSECGDIAPILQIAERLESERFIQAFAALGERNAVGCAQKTETVYRQLYGEDELLPLLLHPNNLLGVEYTRALIREKSCIRPLAFLRTGMGHHDNVVPEQKLISSAGAARNGLLCGRHEEVLSRMPQSVAPLFREAIERGTILSDEDCLLSHMLLYYRGCDKNDLIECDGMAGGLCDRVLRAARESVTPNEFFAVLRTKKYTDAYLRRALLYGLFGIRRELLNAPPAFTQILAMNERGQSVLACARRHSSIPMLNRPSKIHQFGEAATISLRADSVYCALLEQPLRPSDLIRQGPLREKT